MVRSQADAAKQELRERAKALRSALAPEERAEADALIFAGVLSLPEYARAETILAYLDFGTEVRTRDIIVQAWAAGKAVALPRADAGSRRLVWYEVESFDGLIRSTLGVEEPDPEGSLELDPNGCGRALALVPGLIFDEAGYRLGYGGGYYDAFLAGFDGACAGLCREAQMVRDLRAASAVAEHDLPVGIVVTEERVIRA